MAFWCNGKNEICREYERCGKVNCGVYDGTGGHHIATNADRFRAMSDEELAVWLVKQTAYAESAWSETTYLNYATGRSDTKANAIADTLKWLQQPAEEVM